MHWSENHSWKQARFVAYNVASPYIKNIPRIDKWYPLPTDKDHINYERMDDDKANRVRAMIRSAFSKKK